MPTPHISAGDDDFASTVLMPGDPLRARHIAEHFLSDARKVTSVRAMDGFTGTWNGTPISVMPSGMGVPSAAIYITELVRHYRVRRILRVGTAGVYDPDLALRNIVIADTAVTNSNLPRVLGASEPFAATPAIANLAEAVAGERGLAVTRGTVFTSDVFYEPTDETREHHTANGVLCVEMEAAALYSLAQLEGFEAVALLTMTDHLVTGEHLSALERQHGVDEMIALALDVATR